MDVLAAAVDEVFMSMSAKEPLLLLLKPEDWAAARGVVGATEERRRVVREARTRYVFKHWDRLFPGVLLDEAYSIMRYYADTLPVDLVHAAGGVCLNLLYRIGPVLAEMAVSGCFVGRGYTADVLLEVARACACIHLSHGRDGAAGVWLGCCLHCGKTDDWSGGIVLRPMPAAARRRIGMDGGTFAVGWLQCTLCHFGGALTFEGGAR